MRGTILGLVAIGCLGCQAAVAGAQSVIISPLKGTIAATARTQISFLGAPSAALSGISVVGSASGHHAGHLRAYAGLTGASFVPSKPFRAGEQVTVTARLRRQTLQTDFRVAIPAQLPSAGFPPVKLSPGGVQSFHSRPDLKPPLFTVTHPAGERTARGDIFATPSLGPGQHGPLILDEHGALIWSQPEPAGTTATDLRVQSYKDKPVLTWWEGKVVAPGFGHGQDVVLGTDYRPVARISAGNGLRADLHEFRITPQGTALITAYTAIRADLSSAKGARSGAALDCVVQEVDIATGLVVWEWHSVSVIGPSASYLPAPTSGNAPYDYFHINSVFVDTAGNLLLSARNTSTVYLISRRTGRPIWRLGGKQSTFRLGPGVRFAFQHDAQRQLHGTVSLFDDEAAPPVRPPSVGKVIRVSLTNKTAKLIRRQSHSPPLLTTSQGNAQPLPNQNSFVGWGALPNITEFDRRGQIVFDGHFPKKENSYRAYRAPWAGQPVDLPSLAVVPGPSGSAAAYASWNGATQVASWRLLAGPNASSLGVVATVPREGFETTIPLPAGAAAAAAEVEALDSAGQVLGASPVQG